MSRDVETLAEAKRVIEWQRRALEARDAEIERLQAKLDAVEALADKWARAAKWSQSGGEGTGGAHRPRIFWDVAAAKVRKALEGPAS